MKPLILLRLLILLLVIVSPLGAQTVSNLSGFQVERIRANSLTIIGLNSSVNPNGSVSRSIGKIFGPSSAAYILGNTNPINADIIWVPNEDGTWLQIFWSPGGNVFPPITRGWRAVGYGDQDMSGTMVNRAFFYESKRDTDWGLAIGGYVRRSNNNITSNKDWTLLNRGTPVPVNFTEANISSSVGILKGNESEADIFWIQKNGLWEGYYYALKQTFPPLTEGWKKIGDGNRDHSYTEISSSAIFLQAPKWAVADNTLPAKRLITIWPPAGFLTKKLTDPSEPPAAMVSNMLDWGFGQNANNLYFVISWPGKMGISYTSEYYDKLLGWTFLATSEGTGGPELLFNYAVVNNLPWGVARVTSEWINW
jgi:hypothetical protein